MTKSVEELAAEIVNEIEREDFIYAMKRYGGFKIKTTAKQILEWWDEI